MDPNEQEATREVHTTARQVGDTTVERQTVKETAAVPGNVLVSRIVWYVAGVIIALLVVRILLYLFGANSGTAFVDFVYAISGIFSVPFTGIFPTPAYGQFALDSASIVAIAVYALLAWGIAKFVVIGSNHTEDV